VGAFYTLSRRRLENQHRLWSQELPGIKPYYAVKCNPEPKLLQWLKEEDVAFDCASAREMTMVKEHAGAEGKDILFANPCKTYQDIYKAHRSKVNLVTADSASEMNKMYMNLYRPNVLLRIAVDDSGASCPFSSKFGLDPDAVVPVAESAYQHVIPIVGFSFHIGSGSSDADAYRRAIETCGQLWQTLLLKDYKLPTQMTLDIGGGWSYDSRTFLKQAKAVRSALANLPHTPQCVIAEPGRFYAAPTHDLYVRVMGKKPSRDGKGWRYTLDESIYGQFSCIPFDHATPTFYRIREKYNDPPRRRTSATFFGRTCDSLDWIGNSIETEELFVGDWLYIPNMGAYTTATSTEFNGFPRPPVYECDDEPDSEDVSLCRNMKFPLASMLKLEG
jgi:ornithine decarboxylase